MDITPMNKENDLIDSSMGLCFLGIVVFAFSNAQAQADEELIQRGNASSHISLRHDSCNPLWPISSGYLRNFNRPLSGSPTLPAKGESNTAKASWIMMKYLQKDGLIQLAHFTGSKSLDFFPATRITIA